MASVDLVARLVETEVFSNLATMQIGQLHSGLADGSIRAIRPKPVNFLERIFDIDAEAEFLDWADSNLKENPSVALLETLKIQVSSGELDKSAAADGLRLLSELASPGSFRCWEGRMMLYLDVMLSREIEDVDDLYSDKTWAEAATVSENWDPVTYSEAVVHEWMKQREDLGQTMDSGEDSRILPTMEAHQNFSERLIRTLHAARENPQQFLLVGRDWTDSSNWGHGEWNLGHLIEAGHPEH